MLLIGLPIKPVLTAIHSAENRSTALPSVAAIRAVAPVATVRAVRSIG